MCQFQLKYLFDHLYILENFFEMPLMNFLAFWFSSNDIRTWFEVIRNDWQKLFLQCELCTKFRTGKTIL